MEASATRERVFGLCEILKTYTARTRSKPDGFPIRLTQDYLDAIESRTEGDFDKLALLREISALRETVRGGAELIQFLSKPDGPQGRAWQIMADRYASEPCVTEMRAEPMTPDGTGGPMRY